MSITENQLRSAMRATAGHVTQETIPALSLRAASVASHADLTRTARDLRKPGFPRRRRWPTVVAPLAAAAAVIAVVAGAVALAGRTTGRPEPATASLDGVPVPRYYLALIPVNINAPKTAHYAQIRDTVSGATLATIRPPKPFATFSAITGAADDRTFVLAAATGTAAPLGRGRVNPVKFFEVRFRPGQHRVVLHSLPIPQVTGSASVTGLALSPDGSRLAVAINTGQVPAPTTQLKLYTLATGAVREWRSPGWIGWRRFDSGSVSWAKDGTLAVNWSDYIHGNHSPLHSNKGTGVYLLDTASRGGSLLGSSRFVLHTGQDGGIQAGDNAMLIPDGTKLVAIEGGLPGAREAFAEFSASTGKRVAVINSRPDATGDLVYMTLLWSNAQGSVLVAESSHLNGQKVSGYHIFSSSDSKIITIPGAPQAGPFGYYVAF